ncbi:MAG: CRISPR-associated endonuclease Cas1 [Minisyncoccia bacterium]
MKNVKHKSSLWLPYLSTIAIKGERLVGAYKGGEFDEKLEDIASIMIYGSSCPLSQEVLEMSARWKIPVCFHRRNMTNVVWISGGTQGSKNDLLTKQILFREDARKRSHIARKLLDAKFRSMQWLMPYPSDLKPGLSVTQMRAIEARHARAYWDKYYALLGMKGNRRKREDAVRNVLDAVSKFVSGILLRWIIYHRLSPQHAYLHEPTEYPALVYDLMEPYRGYIEKIVLNAVRAAISEQIEEKLWVGYAIAQVEDYLDGIVYVDATRQLVTFQELMHGSVLALRAYFIGEAQRYILPVPGKPNGGRPKKVGYRLYGRSAGRTDFWEQSHLYHKRQKKQMGEYCSDQTQGKV